MVTIALIFLVAALICFIISAAKSPGNPWSSIGMAILTTLAILIKVGAVAAK